MRGAQTLGNDLAIRAEMIREAIRLRRLDEAEEWVARLRDDGRRLAFYLKRIREGR